VAGAAIIATAVAVPIAVHKDVELVGTVMNAVSIPEVWEPLIEYTVAAIVDPARRVVDSAMVMPSMTWWGRTVERWALTAAASTLYQQQQW
jgi:hypothetical protein